MEKYYVMYKELFIEDHLNYSWDFEMKTFKDLLEANSFANSLKKNKKYKEVMLLERLPENDL